ncbi:MAG: hypothetical protein LC689_13620 [Myxococcales bacterium]|nr:hypothetical protein [Myxococcales bacterium]
MSGAALAHDVAHPRHEVLRVAASGLRLIVDYEVGAGEPARALRQAFDRDRNGTLDPGEQQGLSEHLARTATLRTRLLVDGAEVPLQRELVRPEKADLPAASNALLAVRVELSAAWPEKKKKNFFDHFLNTSRQVEVRDEDETGHVPISVDCDRCTVTAASSGLPDGPLVRGANTPLLLHVRLDP